MRVWLRTKKVLPAIKIMLEINKQLINNFYIFTNYQQTSPVGKDINTTKSKKQKPNEKERKERRDKIEEMMQNDSTYNMVMKLAHRITDLKNFEDLKKIIPEESAELIDKAFKNKSK